MSWDSQKTWKGERKIEQNNVRANEDRGSNGSKKNSSKWQNVVNKTKSDLYNNNNR